jgi:hypothetical protein
MVVVERIEAADRSRIERAREQTSLEITRRRDRILVCADGPLREPDDCTKWRNGLHMKTEYRVVYEIELRVPRSIDLSIGTIEGDLVVTDVRGRLDVSGVQGNVEITGAAAAVRVGPVGGSLHARFVENPRDDSRFSTINGGIDVGFQPDMSADLSFESMNGKVVTDFDYRILQPVVRRTDSPDPGTVYRLEVDNAIRIADGGPRYRFTTIDGNITIHRN